jgi:hypothetical protein
MKNINTLKKIKQPYEDKRKLRFVKTQHTLELSIVNIVDSELNI